MPQIDLNKYAEFVKAVTSAESKDLTTLMDRIVELDVDSRVNIPLLLTAAIGLAAEGGEFCEIPKKIFFQGKPLDTDTIFHMKRELGDIIWYWTNACRALNVDPNEVISMNVEKLESRYPGGKFDAFYSENRKQGDL